MQIKRRRKKILIICLAIVLGVLLIASLIHKLNSPVEGTISKTTTATKTPVTDTTEYSTLNNDYFYLLYPSNLSPDYPQQKAGGALVYSYLSKQDANQKLSDSLEVYVRNLPHGGVTLDSDYRSYQSRQKVYKLSQKFIRGETVDVATGKLEMHERGALWVHGTYLLILKLKSVSQDDIDTKFNTILKSIQWQKS